MHFVASLSFSLVWPLSIFETWGQGTISAEAAATEAGGQRNSSAPSLAESKTPSNWVSRKRYIMLSDFSDGYLARF